jgi:hypothetical protein
LRRALITILAECMQVSLPGVAAPTAAAGENFALLRMLRDAIERIDCAPGMPEAHKRSALDLVEYAQRADATATEINRLACDEAAGFLGRRLEDRREREAALERFVQSAGPGHFEMLLKYFARQIERQVLIYGSTAVGGSASRVGFSPIT